MNERLMQYIWRAGHFNKSGIKTLQGEPIEIIDAGKLNSDQGPDFLNAKISLNGSIWAGSIELHIKEEDWQKHGHEEDENYRNVILHVVWDSSTARIKDIPTISLSPLVPKILLDRFDQLMRTDQFIPCQATIKGVPDLHLIAWKERLMIERLIRKTIRVQSMLSATNFHWEETSWRMLARSFGNPVNADAFEALAGAVPLQLLSRHRHNLIQLEAILLGQAGQLNGKFKENYPILLQKEYKFQQKKYGLRPILMPLHFLRMRPGNFPTIRLAQLAKLIFNTDRLFSFLLECEKIDHFKKELDLVANDYWHYHYRLDEESPYMEKRLGRNMIENLVINTVVPLQFAYGHIQKEQAFKDRALHLLEQLPPENNRQLRKFNELGIKADHAFDSQSLFEMKSSYCDLKKCLECSIGSRLLTPNS